MTAEYLGDDEAVQIVIDEGFHVADMGLFLSALARPKMSVFGEDAYPSLWDKAAALMHSLARNHALADGNKRTSLLLTGIFLRLNGQRLRRNPETEDFVVSVAVGEADLATIARWLETHSS